MKKRPGSGIVDVMLAVVVLCAGMVPVVGGARPGSPVARPARSDIVVADLARSCLARLAAPRRGADSLPEMLAGGYTAEQLDVITLAKLTGSPSAGLAELVESGGLSLRFERRQRLVSADRTGRDRSSLSVWVIQARWAEGPVKKSRFFFRMAQQG